MELLQSVFSQRIASAPPADRTCSSRLPQPRPEGVHHRPVGRLLVGHRRAGRLGEGRRRAGRALACRRQECRRQECRRQACRRQECHRQVDLPGVGRQAEGRRQECRRQACRHQGCRLPVGRQVRSTFLFRPSCDAQCPVARLCPQFVHE